MGASEIFIDFETRSEADLKKVGAWEYSVHPSTEIICMGWLDSETDEEGVESYFDPGTWWPRFCNRLVVAHNAGFERSMWLNQLTRRYNWPEIKPENWRCTAAIARANGYPGGLEAAALAMGLAEQKDTVGAALMRKMCRPLPKWRKTGEGPKWHEDPKDFERLGEYCLQDVRTTKAILDRLGHLSPSELAIWQLDQIINLRGIAVDTELIEAACDTCDQLSDEARERIRELTDEAVSAPSETEKVRKWLGVLDCQRKTLSELLPTITDPVKREVVELRISDSRAANKKYFALRDRTISDGRLRDSFIYYGAHTGRWSGKGAQGQNLKRPDYDQVTIEQTIIPAVTNSNLSLIETLFGDVAKPMASCIRSSLIAKKGHDLVCADYKSIEAVVLMWLTGDTKGLELFRRGKDIYVQTASIIYNKPYEEVTKAERYIGKIARLGLGYGMGAAKFVRYAKEQWGVEIDDLFGAKVVNLYRQRNPGVPKLWKQLETYAKLAIQCPTMSYPGYAGLKFKYTNNILSMRLPSGRVIKYNKAKIVQGKYGPALSYLSNKGTRIETWGGTLTENAVQAISRDITANGMLRAEQAGYSVVFTAHDEIVSEIPEWFGSLDEFCQLICDVPPWLAGCPVMAEGWRGKRYRK